MTEVKAEIIVVQLATVYLFKELLILTGTETRQLFSRMFVTLKSF